MEPVVATILVHRNREIGIPVTLKDSKGSNIPWQQCLTIGPYSTANLGIMMSLPWSLADAGIAIHPGCHINQTMCNFRMEIQRKISNRRTRSSRRTTPNRRKNSSSTNSRSTTSNVKDVHANTSAAHNLSGLNTGITKQISNSSWVQHSFGADKNLDLGKL